MNIDKVQPVGEYVLIKMPDKESYDTASLIINMANEYDNNKGVVKAVGDKVNTDKNSVKIEEGQTVIFIPGNGVKLTNSETSDILISVKNIIGIVKGE